MKNSPDSTKLAIRFCDELKRQLGNETIADINRLNATEDYARVCASHDFCDSNQVMSDSLELLGFEYHIDLNEVINDAWTQAKMAGFAADTIIQTASPEGTLKLATIKREFLSEYKADMTYVVVETKDTTTVLRLLNFPARPAIEVPTEHVRVFDELENPG